MIKNDGPKNATLKTGKIVKKPGKKPVPHPRPLVGRRGRLTLYVAHGGGTCANQRHEKCLPCGWNQSLCGETRRRTNHGRLSKEERPRSSGLGMVAALDSQL